MDDNMYLYKVKEESYKRDKRGIIVNLKKSQKKIFGYYLYVQKIWDDFMSEIEQQLTNELNIMPDGSVCRMTESDSIFTITIDKDAKKFITKH